MAALILGFSRAIGETMVVAIAAGGTGGSPAHLNPLEPRPDDDRRDRVARDRVRPGARGTGDVNPFEPSTSSASCCSRSRSVLNLLSRALRPPGAEGLLMVRHRPAHGTASEDASSSRSAAKHATSAGRCSRRALLLTLLLSL